MESRYEIMMENYVKVLHIEALTMAEMAERDILPAVSGYAHSLTDTVLAKRSLGAEIDTSYEYSTVKKISSLTASAYEKLETLKRVVSEADTISDFEKTAFYYRDMVIPAMEALRGDVDLLETMTDTAIWPFPTYGKLLFGII